MSNIIKNDGKKKIKETDKLKKFDKEIKENIDKFEKLRNSKVYLLFPNTIDNNIVENIYYDLREKFKDNIPETLDVILDSGGGKIDAAYNLALLLRRYTKNNLNIIIPRWAKSAATLIACAGDRIYMTPISEIGPVDPQITMINPLEKRLEEFSPLDIDSTLKLIREEFKNGDKNLAQGLLDRLQFPLTLGGIKKSLEVGIHYIKRLLSSRMLKEDKNKAEQIAEKLVESYTTHGFCIEIDETICLGLKAELLPENELSLLINIYKLFKEKKEFEEQIKKEKNLKLLKKIPPDLLKDFPFDINKLDNNNSIDDNKNDNNKNINISKEGNYAY